MSNKIRFYAFESKDDKHGVKFVPYDQTPFELIAIRDNFDTKGMFSKMKANTEGYLPTYNPDKSYSGNLQDLQAKLGYWPIPLTHQFVYEDIEIQYDEVWTKETSKPDYKHRWDIEEFKHFYE